MVGKPGSRDVSIDYLRTTLTLMVLAHHSSLAYTSWAYFNRADIYRSTAPIVDSTRWAFFDYAENFNDVFFMSLMFFVSGLFVYPALRRHGTLQFIRDRLLRLGVPFAFAVAFLIPLAYYAAWQVSGRDTGFVSFYERLARSGFTVGPPWFIWVLLLFDVLLALVARPLARWMPSVERLMRGLKDHAVATFAVVTILAGAVYLPLLARYGFNAWTVLFTSPFAFQISRIGLYALWFLLGVLTGAPGFQDGLLSKEGALARRWPAWVAACVVAYNLLWFVPRLAVTRQASVSSQGAIEALLWVVSCSASSFGFLAVFRGLTLRPRAWMLSLSRSAYVMYLVHYVFITWTQRALLDRPIPAGVKFLMVFSATTLLSWLTAQVLLRVPKLATIL